VYFILPTIDFRTVYAVGLDDEDFNKPQIGISPVWWEGGSISGSSHFASSPQDQSILLCRKRM
jgi:hypothetical protein